MIYRITLSTIVLFSMLLCLTSCGEKSPTEPIGTGQKPTILSMSVQPTQVPRLGTSTISCDAYDPDDDPLTYSWTCQDGSFPTTGPGVNPVVWRAPDSDGSYRVSVAVSDGNNNTVSSSVSVTVSGYGLATVSGDVFDAEGGGLISNASVCFASCYTTGLDGHYQTGYVSAGNAIVTIYASGYGILVDTTLLVQGENTRNFGLDPTK